MLRMTYEALLADAPRELARLFEWLAASDARIRLLRVRETVSGEHDGAWSRMTRTVRVPWTPPQFKSDHWKRYQESRETKRESRYL